MSPQAEYLMAEPLSVLSANALFLMGRLLRISKYHYRNNVFSISPRQGWPFILCWPAQMSFSPITVNGISLFYYLVGHTFTLSLIEDTRTLFWCAQMALSRGIYTALKKWRQDAYTEWSSRSQPEESYHIHTSRDSCRVKGIIGFLGK